MGTCAHEHSCIPTCNCAVMCLLSVLDGILDLCINVIQVRVIREKKVSLRDPTVRHFLNALVISGGGSILLWVVPLPGSGFYKKVG